jgi:hypothetical protein
LLIGALRTSSGYLADVTGLIVDVHQQRLKLLLKEDIVVWATETPMFAKFQIGDATDGASPLVEPCQLVGRLAHGEMLRQQPRHGRQYVSRLFLARTEKRLGTFFAQMHLARFTVNQVGNVKGRLSVAFLALHRFTIYFAVTRRTRLTYCVSTRTESLGYEDSSWGKWTVKANGLLMSVSLAANHEEIVRCGALFTMLS